MSQVRLPQASVAVILPAAGASRRFGGTEKKIFASLGGLPLWQHAASRLRSRPEVGAMLLVIDPEDRERWEHEFVEPLDRLNIRLVDGGSQRSTSHTILGVVPDSSRGPLVAIFTSASARSGFRSAGTE